MYKNVQKCTIFWILFWKKVQKSTKKVVKSKGDFLWRVVTTYSKLYFFYLWQVKKVPKRTISKWYIFLMLIVLVLVLILVLIQPPENLDTEVRHKGLAISMKVGLRCNKISFCLGEEWDQYRIPHGIPGAFPCQRMSGQLLQTVNKGRIKHVAGITWWVETMELPLVWKW